jgi:alginate O-acetyltransferase complex protein AlgI
VNAWASLLFLVAGVYLAFKALTLRPLPKGRALGYLALWPGMDPGPFERTVPGRGTGLMAWGASKMALGALLLSCRLGWPPGDLVRVLLGIAFLIHLGLCDVLAGFWRLRGVPVERLFDNPAAARSLSEFWGRRWNRAFHVVARLFIYRPVSRRWGRTCGLGAAFGFSGLLHDLLLSVPAGGGWGGPTLYFLLQGALVWGERRWGFQGSLWTIFWLIVPAPLLFHRAFVEAILRPLL